MRYNAKLRSMLTMIPELEEMSDYTKAEKFYDQLSESAWGKVLEADDVWDHAVHEVNFRRAQAMLYMVRYLKALDYMEECERDLRAKGGVYGER